MAEARVKCECASARRALIVSVMLLCLTIFFRDTLLTGLHMLYGDAYDGMIEVSILEHWYRVFTAGAPWDVTGYFYPYPATLGYNDTYLIPGVPFTLARVMGADPFLAAFASHVFMKALGFSGMYVLLRRGFAVRTLLALAGAAVFTTANVSLVHMYHAQLLSIGVFPWLGFLARQTFSALRNGRPRALTAWGCGFAMLYGLAALSAFYGLWFFSLFFLIYAPIALMLAGAGERRALGRLTLRYWRALLASILVGLVGLTPMLLLYVPKASAGAQHSWQDAHLFLLNMTTLFDVGTGNVIWGRLPAMLGYTLPLPGGETRFGLPIGLMATTMFAMLWAWREREGSVLALGGAVIAVGAFAWQWPGDHSAWWYIYSYVPGASAIRVVSRLLLFALVPVIVIVIVFLDRAPRSGWATALILALLLVEQVQLEAPLMLDRDAHRAMLTAVGRPPADCASFFVVSARAVGYPQDTEARAIDIAWGGSGRAGPSIVGLYRHNVDAMLLASYYGIPTINGFSSFNPPSWNLASPDASDYLHRVDSYARAQKLNLICGLDMRKSIHWFRLGGLR